MPILLRPRRLAGILAIAALAGPAGALETGAALYAEHCAQCHGPDGAGDGTAAEFAAVKPADLRTLSARNGGAFPLADVVATIDGVERLEGHNPGGMPAWGEVFRFDEENGDALAHARILNLVLHLYGMQE